MADARSNRARAMWKSCLNSAFRTALACIIVGITTLHGPTVLRRLIIFPAFSYVNVILIITNATLGDAVRGCWHALCATVQSVCPAIFCLWMIGPNRLAASSTALLVAVCSFFVVLPEWSHLVAKRIALGQVVLVYVIGYINGGGTNAVMHPVHVAASTAAGALACVLALLLPYPRLACREVRQNSEKFAENASERLKLFVNAFCAESMTSSQALLLQAKSLSIEGAKLLQCIKSKQESTQWEKLPIKILKPPNCMEPGEKFQAVEILLRGLETALTSSSFPFGRMDEELKDRVNRLEEHVSLTLKQKGSCLPLDSSTVPESDSGGQVMDQFLQTLQTVPKSQEDLPSLFFLYCLMLRQNDSLAATCNSKHGNPIHGKDDPNDPHKQNGTFSKRVWSKLPVIFNRKRLMPALKCSLSLGFAVLFGLIYSKENGYWSALPVAISLASDREATFKVANVKAQGTVIGTVYGVLGCFLFERFVQVRFLALLPWFIFTSFLQQSRMYGQAGAISAVIGAVLILGRKNFGPPSNFAIARIIETFIGLSCSILVEMLLQPRRAACLAKTQLSKALEGLQNCLESIDLRKTTPNLLESQKWLRSEVTELGKFIGEADVEPNFWFLPFHGACYGKLLESLSKTADLLLFSAHAISFLQRKFPKSTDLKEELDKLNGDFELIKNTTKCSVKCLKEITLIKSLCVTEKLTEKNNISSDLELGKAAYDPFHLNEDEMGKIMSSYIKHIRGMAGRIFMTEEDELLEGRTILSLSALGFCMSGLVKEIKEIERGIKELVQWENPRGQINWNEISCKIHAQYE
ncbi:hypothetical protein Nepgr_009259 [Nepenthes gracilis]|uniref:Integral membrane bound transporter domain-containing protein n=1 Tax=Nepenthes gracilis TaxID=150966 RepID=A0AAD3SB18_NEPGR|nr:hypothetical protein Nepgr_009259 [Nepenthes gracilis]